MHKLIFNQTYHGFEALADVDRDVSEALDASYNPVMDDIPAEFRGKITVTITYDDNDIDATEQDDSDEEDQCVVLYT